MKISIATSILILLIAALIGVPNHQRMVALRESHGKLVATAAQFGIAMDSNNPDETARVTKRTRENKEVDAKAFAADFIAFAREMKAKQEKSDPPDEARQKRSMEMMERMTSLDAAQLKTIIAEFHKAEGLDDDMREGLISFSVITLAGDQPQAALDLLTGPAGLLKDHSTIKHIVSSSLTSWAKNDPVAALNWVKKNSAEFPDLITDAAKRGTISGTAFQDPHLAFKLIDDLGIKEVGQSIDAIVSAAKTPEERTTTLNALREHLTTLPDDKARTEISESAMRGLTNITVAEGFEASTRWLADASFTAKELENFAGGLQGSIKRAETGKWIEWIGEKLPPEKAKDNIDDIVRDWTRNDYQAAGQWLISAPAGPAKDAAIQSYAVTVSEYEPATAAQWAVTLPPGNDRDQTLKTIYRNWPKEDTAAREAFKQEHGIK